ncbi:hypothetical protein CQ393_10160 [Stenotrophomonas sp. MYb238]|uniref:hypothetical protein n=1 Tax=Stenotrophomonas sp. MYb238 TaxID=2040281 RepID=UPI0012922BE9|nr:hypothetical protein [Stenotrophomonas sp. MYb238]MQP76256.1 hypothetical protein [Stenotrophomonas sp. MYb238]
MLTFNLSEMIQRRLPAVVLKQLFLYKTTSEYAIAVMVAADPAGQLICKLTGETAFQFESFDARQGQRVPVLPLPISTADLRLRVDPASHVADPHEISPGRLIVLSGQGPCIFAEWHKPAHDVPNLLNLSTWEPDYIDKPTFGFDRWSLSCVDETGCWSDLVSRNPAQQ